MLLADIREAEPWTFTNILGLIVLIVLVAAIIWLVVRFIVRR